MSVSISACLDGHPHAPYTRSYSTTDGVPQLIAFYIEGGFITMETGLKWLMDHEAGVADFEEYLKNYVRQA
jgi:hypothetical protein